MKGFLAKAGILAAVTLFLGACSLLPHAHQTEYGAGKSIINGKSGFKTANFIGDTSTQPQRAYRFSRLAAIDDCESDGKFAVLVSTTDFSEKTRYTQISSYPTYPYYGRYGRYYYPMGRGMFNNTYAYPVTEVSPRYATVFKCVSRLMHLKNAPELDVLSRELVSPVTHDFKGGLMVKDPEKETVFKEGDVIVNINGKRVENLDELQTAVSAAVSETVPVRLIREQKFMTVTVGVVDGTADLKRMNGEEIAKACEMRADNDKMKIRLCEAQSGTAKDTPH